MIKSILEKNNFDADDIVRLLSITNSDELEQLRQAAYNTMLENIGEKVYLRGLIEFSNICINDCNYCGIRKSNSEVKRYTLSKEEIIESAKWAAKFNYGSVVLQSGDRTDEQFIDFVIDLVRSIKQETTSEIYPNGLGITLCVGEQTYETYKKFFDAGAHRYLLRIETTNPILFSEIHPKEQTIETRIEALKSLKKAGFQVGTGVMIGLPNQTIEDLANDILFFRDFDIDMIGMGPFIPHHATPLGHLLETAEQENKQRYELTLKMIAVCRIVLKDVNIAATTALQAIHPTGREEGLRHGANIIMPQTTPTEVRQEYMLYEGKPCISEFAAECHACLDARITSIGRPIAYGEWGDPRHFFNKKNEV